MTLRSHTIKMVFACNRFVLRYGNILLVGQIRWSKKLTFFSVSLSELFPNNQELGRLARVAAYYACLHAIG